MAMTRRVVRYLNPERAGASVGMSAEWVRKQISTQRLPATVFLVGGRVTYRIRDDDWAAFLRAHTRRTDKDDWE